MLLLVAVVPCPDATWAAPKVETYPIEIEKPMLRLEPAPEYPPIKEVGGVRIEMISIPPETKKMILVTLEDRTGVADFLTSSLKSVWIWETPLYEIQPPEVQFQVRVTNKLTKVLRLQGVAMQFAIDGKTVPTDYTKNILDKAILLPNQTWEGILYGPPVEGLQQKSGVLQAGIYDVITEVDDANNPLKKSNFEWIYTYQLTKTKEMAEKKRSKGAVTLEQARAVHGRKRPAE